jgi:A/G-specific adenine glycosylase
MRTELFSSKIIDWYKANQRQLPWRTTKDPYRIWLSEVILQQTRVAQGLPYYERFIKIFPSVRELAKAPEKKVLRLWQGLGYYSRARNLHQCAKYIVKYLDQKFPDTFEELKKLPGIGSYTAAAIASISFSEPVAVVDGNVFRVISRVFGIDHDIGSTDGKKYFSLLANKLIDKDRPELFNQAIMELGALQCLPRNPLCEDCIFTKSCEANKNNLQGLLPVKSKKTKARTRYFYYFIIRQRNKMLLRKREGKDIWQGLYDFYLIETVGRHKPNMLIKKDMILMKSLIISESEIYKHILSHQKLFVKFVTVEIPFANELEPVFEKLGLKWFSKERIERLPKPILIDRFLKEKIHEPDFW